MVRIVTLTLLDVTTLPGTLTKTSVTRTADDLPSNQYQTLPTTRPDKSARAYSLDSGMKVLWPQSVTLQFCNAVGMHSFINAVRCQ